MRPIHVMFDETLLKRLDADPEVRKSGRSAVLRRAAAAYLRRSGLKRIAESYRSAYEGPAGLGDAFGRWENEGVWPES